MNNPYSKPELDAELAALPKIRDYHANQLICLTHRQIALLAAVPVGSVPSLISRNLVVHDKRTGAMRCGDLVEFCDRSILAVSQRILRSLGVSEREYAANTTVQERARQMVVQVMTAIQRGETPPV